MFPTAKQLLFVTIATAAAAAQSPIDPQLARQYFAEAHSACAKDAGKLWGVSLCGPMIFVEPRSGAVVANQRDADGQLVAKDGMFVGTWPKEENVANHAVKWSGTLWTQLRWPISAGDPVIRQDLLAHEMFHRVQEHLGFAGASPANAHLDSEQGRVLLRAEMRALRSALTSTGNPRKNAAIDALNFRHTRQKAFLSATAEEDALELNEGLAEYTGIRLSRATLPERLAAAAKALEEADQSDSYVRSFAYSTGPAYGLLLDALVPNWRTQMLKHPKSLAGLLQASLKINPVGLVSSDSYGLKHIEAEETERTRKRQALMAAAQARFVDGPTLVIPLVKAQVQFDPNNPYPFGENGTIYPNIRISDQWGILDVKSGGALVCKDWSKVTVTASGEGWELRLMPGWSKKAGKRVGDLIISKD